MDQNVEPRLKLWIELDGRVVLSAYRARLLRLIEETGSLAEAAERMQLSYRRAWGKIRDVEGILGVRLVQSDTGGAGGGGSRLTPEAADLLRRYEAFEASVADAAHTLFRTSWSVKSPDRDAPVVYGARRLWQRGENVEAVTDNAIDSPPGELKREP
jgi:molybdate transport system regulatory protein